jgi:hypothetical protein
MKLAGTAMCMALAAGYLVLGTTPGRTAANVIDAQNSCNQAALCAAAAEAERENPKNPGMGPKFNGIKRDCSALAAQCQRDMNAPEPKYIPQR